MSFWQYFQHKVKTMLKIMLTGGGSGGPTIPLICVYETLQKKLGKDQVNALFLGTYSGIEKSLVEKAGIRFEPIPSGKFRRYWSWQNFRDPFYIMAGFFVGVLKLLQFRPHIVVSAGSFASVPVAYAAKVLGIPHLILQMDARAGLANRLMKPVSVALAHWFELSAKQFKGIPTHQIGVMARQSIKEGNPKRANELFHLNPEKPLLLITGGGQGAFSLNLALENVLELLLESFQIVHLTGKNYQPQTYEGYQAVEFVTAEMGDLLARADVVITRAGMSAIAELVSLQKEMILVPLPNSHQEDNAKQIQQGTFYLAQDEIDKEWFEHFLKSYQKGRKIEKMMMKQNGEEEFANLILHYSETSSSSRDRTCSVSTVSKK